ncbi:MAG: YqiA/YcfP family alpha/beta fold hydrolase [Acidobacteriota bacterium]
MRTLYLHGFASGPSSTKGVVFERHFAARGVAIERLDLRVPSFEHLRLSAMIDAVTARLAERTVLIGSSLGGLTAARVAERFGPEAQPLGSVSRGRDRRGAAVVLMAPAFHLADRWREVLGDEWETWRQTGWREITDYTTGKPARVDFGFVEDVAAIDVGLPELAVPALVLHGTRDDVVPIERSRDFQRANPQARLVELDDGHELVASLPRLLGETEAFLEALA